MFLNGGGVKRLKPPIYVLGDWRLHTFKTVNNFKCRGADVDEGTQLKLATDVILDRHLCLNRNFYHGRH